MRVFRWYPYSGGSCLGHRDIDREWLLYLLSRTSAPVYEMEVEAVHSMYRENCSIIKKYMKKSSFV